jgi:hypothetical protein
MADVLPPEVFEVDPFDNPGFVPPSDPYELEGSPPPPDRAIVLNEGQGSTALQGGVTS